MVESANLAYQTVEDQSSTTDLLESSISSIQKLDVIDYVDVEQILKKANIPPSLSIKDRIKCIKKISDNIYQEMISIHLKQTLEYTGIFEISNVIPLMKTFLCRNMKGLLKVLL